MTAVRLCSCGHLITDDEQRVHSIGFVGVPADDEGPAYALEQYNCPACRTTLATEMTLDDFAALLRVGLAVWVDGVVAKRVLR